MCSFPNAWATELSKSRDEGRALLSVVPNVRLQSKDSHLMIPWTGSVEAWTERAQKMLSGYSDRAAYEFVNVEPKTNTNFGFPFAHISIGGQPFEPYECLVVRLEVLGRILERPEAYFKAVVKPKAPS